MAATNVIAARPASVDPIIERSGNPSDNNRWCRTIRDAPIDC
jgi:hypothetical protein